MWAPALLCACNWSHWLNWACRMGQVVSCHWVLNPRVFGFNLFLFWFPSHLFFLDGGTCDLYQRLLGYSRLLEDRKIKLNLSELDVSSFHGLTFFSCLALVAFHKSWNLPTILFNLVNLRNLNSPRSLVTYSSVHFASPGAFVIGYKTPLWAIRLLSSTQGEVDLIFRGRLMNSFLFRRKMYCGNEVDYLW